jgi:hypothetical protein
VPPERRKVVPQNSSPERYQSAQRLYSAYVSIMIKHDVGYVQEQMDGNGAWDYPVVEVFKLETVEAVQAGPYHLQAQRGGVSSRCGPHPIAVAHDAFAVDSVVLR